AGKLIANNKARKTQEIKKLDRNPLHHADFSTILKSYNFVGDFSRKPEERHVSEELFWRYPLTVGKIDFPFFPELNDLSREIPTTIGDGQPYQHLNLGRNLFLKNNFDE